MVTGLADLLRYSLASDRTETVSLADELRIVDEYLALEHVRLEERLQIERAIDPAALDARIPPMLIQTLVDNAIKHGIAALPRGGIVASRRGRRWTPGDRRREFRAAEGHGLRWRTRTAERDRAAAPALRWRGLAHAHRGGRDDKGGHGRADGLP